MEFLCFMSAFVLSKNHLVSENNFSYSRVFAQWFSCPRMSANVRFCPLTRLRNLPVQVSTGREASFFFRKRGLYPSSCQKMVKSRFYFEKIMVVLNNTCVAPKLYVFVQKYSILITEFFVFSFWLPLQNQFFVFFLSFLALPNAGVYQSKRKQIKKVCPQKNVFLGFVTSIGGLFIL